MKCHISAQCVEGETQKWSLLLTGGGGGSGVVAVVDFIAETGTAFRVVGQPSFKKVLNIANNRIQLKDPKTY